MQRRGEERRGDERKCDVKKGKKRGDVREEEKGERRK